MRKRVSEYNNGIIPSELGFFGDANNLEWKQYTLSEPNTKNLEKCPFKVIK
ncbi:MAG: YqcI/YcgG family protein [Neisseriaceae bacterium]|nr:YqcI/YcgG family protein [Neisseriaceae bacterium]